MKRTLTTALLALFAMAALSGCNTVAGAGKDMQRAGEAIEERAEG